MKKQLIKISIIAVATTALILSGCKKDDATLPVVTLIGSATINISLNSAYTDLGATATDNKDGDVTSKITVSNPVNKDLAGTYTVKYSVTDAAGNIGTADRTVNVVNDAASMAGTYSSVMVYDNGTLVQSRPTDCSSTAANSITDVIAISTTVNNELLITRFAGYVFATGSTKIKMKVSGTATGSSITVSSQTTTNIGCPMSTNTYTFVGSGTVTTTGFNLTWTETNTGGGNFPNQTATYVK